MRTTIEHYRTTTDAAIEAANEIGEILVQNNEHLDNALIAIRQYEEDLQLRMVDQYH